MTYSEAALNAEVAAKRLADVSVRLQNVANDLRHATVPEARLAAVHAFKRVQRQANDALCAINDAEMNLFTAK